MAVRPLGPSRTVDRAYALGEIAILLIFVVTVAIRGAATIDLHFVEVAFLGACAAASQAFRIRVSAVDEKIAFGIAGGILALALPSADVLTTVLVWAVGVTAGAAIVARSLSAGARVGGRSVLLGLTYSSVLTWTGMLHAPLFVSITLATAAYLGASLLLWRLPAIVAEDSAITSHFIPRRIALLFVLNATIPLITHYAEPQAHSFILSDPARMKLIMDLTVTTALFSVLALVLFGYDARHRLDGVIRTAKALPWPDDPDPLQQMTGFAAATLNVDKVEVRTTPPRSRFEIATPFRTHTGETRYLVALRNSGRSPLLDRDLEALDAIAHIGQETMRVRGEAQDLRTEANTDPLTGLFNYRAFQVAIDDVNLRRSDQSGVALVYLDLDGFKHVNDQFGHEVGNQVLREVALRLQDAVRPRDTVARVGGDEFVILLRDVKDRRHAEQVAQRIVAAASRPVVAGEQVLAIRLSDGVAFTDDHTESLDSLVNEADSLMYARRGRRLTGDALSRANLDEESHFTGRRAAIADLITSRELNVVYQPIVDAVKGTVVGLEALVRGTHASYGRIDPALLVHEARRLDLLDQVTEQVLERTFADIARIQKVVPALADVHVNVELGQLSRECIQQQLQRLSATHPGIRLTLEMTENSLHGAGEDMLARLGELRASGIRLALDDFGQGYSTMLAVVEFPFDALKIDRSLIAAVTTSGKSVQVIRSLARLCKNLHVTMVVEGVELPEERDVLLRLGAKHMQGFLFSRPESADDLCARFAARGLGVG